MFGVYSLRVTAPALLGVMVMMFALGGVLGGNIAKTETGSVSGTQDEMREIRESVLNGFDDSVSDRAAKGMVSPFVTGLIWVTNRGVAVGYAAPWFANALGYIGPLASVAGFAASTYQVLRRLPVLEGWIHG